MTLPAYAMSQTSFPQMYEQTLVGPLFRPWAELLLDDVGLAAGDRVLDIACGTGIVARLAKERLGGAAKVVGIDLSPQMLAVARSAAPTIDWREGNASALPLPDGEQFDVVLCQQGLQFFADKPAAAREMHRAVAARGRVAVSTWRPLDEIPFFRDLHGIAQRHLGPIVDQRHEFADAGALETLLRQAGFSDVRVRTLSCTMRFSDGAALLRLNTMALVGMSAASKEMSDDERARVVPAIVDDSAEVLRRFTGEAGVEFELSTNVGIGRALPSETSNG